MADFIPDAKGSRATKDKKHCAAKPINAQPAPNRQPTRSSLYLSLSLGKHDPVIPHILSPGGRAFPQNRRLRERVPPLGADGPVAPAIVPARAVSRTISLIGSRA